MPVAIAVAVAFATRSATARRCAGALAAASGIVVAHVVVVGVPRLPPIDTIGWIPFAAAVTCVGLLVEPRPVVRLVVTFVVATIAIRLVGRPVWHSAIDAAPWALLVGAGTTAIDASLVVASRRMPPAGVLLAFAMTMAGGSIACLFGHSALLAQVLGASAAVIGASGVVAIFVTPAKTPAKTIASIAAVSAVAVMAYASLYATLSTVVVVLLVGSAVAPIVAAALPVTPRARAVVAVA
ncbi:MAG: hypothetical protein ABI704_05800, partial [Kofleriaceae bacterium]